MITNFNKLIIIIILFLVICVVYNSFLIKDYFKTSNSFKFKPLNGCGFYPKGITKLACKDRCSNIYDRDQWGGTNCNEENCSKICNNCTNPNLCRWLEKIQKNKKDIYPKTSKIIGLSGDRSAQINWIKPNSKYPILFYVAVIESNYISDKLRTDFINDIKCTNCNYKIHNLINDIEYSIYIIARNKYGYSEPSNKLKIVPKSTNLNNAEFDTKTNKYVESKPTVKNIDSKFSFEYDNSGMITDVNQTSYDDTDYINMFSKLINEKNISSKIKTNYNFELI